MEHSFNENRGLTLVGFLVTACVIIFLLLMLLLLTLAYNRPVPVIAMRVVCQTNLKLLGTAMTVYANDYDGRFPQLPGEGPWSKKLGFDYDLKEPDFKGLQSNTGRTITASWYLLVREADVSSKSFVCPLSKEKGFEGKKPYNFDIVENWDFGDNPYEHVSYGMHNPYGKYPANDKLGTNFAVAADMSPWIKAGDFVSTPNEYNNPQIIKANDETTYKYGNSFNHPKKKMNWRGQDKEIIGTATGQNVLFVDGHTEFTRQPNCGVNDDNIYTYWSTEKNPTEQDIQGGTQPTARDKENDAKSQDDSFLVL